MEYSAIKYGYVVINSWLKFDGEKFIGMGATTEFDRNGNITKHTVKESGLIATFEKAPKKITFLRRFLTFIRRNICLFYRQITARQKVC